MQLSWKGFIFFEKEIYYLNVFVFLGKSIFLASQDAIEVMFDTDLLTNR